MSETIYSLYQTTNLVNGKVYVGVHLESRYPEVDDYLGSGVALSRAIEKYGRENFVRVFLAVFDSADAAFEAEAGYVTEEFITEDNYNMCVGGKGGATNTGRVWSEEALANMARNNRENPGFLGKTHAPESIEKMRGPRGPESEETRAKKSASMSGKKKSAEHRRKISEAARGRVMDEETRAKISDTLKANSPMRGRIGDKHHNSKAILIDGTRYGSMQVAADALGLGKSTIHRRVKNPKFPGYSYA